MPSYGQFGTPGYFQSDIPTDIVQQYPGTQNIKQAGQMFGNLLYGPLSRAYGITGAQATDPAAAAFQAQAEGGGGAFAQPGGGTAELGSLFGGLMGGNAAEQAARQKQQVGAAGGLLDVAKAYGQNIDTTQRAALDLEMAKQQQQAQQAQGIMGLMNMFTSPFGAGANILGPGGLNVLDPGQSPFGGLMSALGIGGGSVATPSIAGFGSLADVGGAVGMTAPDISGIFSSLATAAPELAAFAA